MYVSEIHVSDKSPSGRIAGARVVLSPGDDVALAIKQAEDAVHLALTPPAPAGPVQPLVRVIIRGTNPRDPAQRAELKADGFQWSSQTQAWTAELPKAKAEACVVKAKGAGLNVTTEDVSA